MSTHILVEEVKSNLENQAVSENNCTWQEVYKNFLAAVKEKTSKMLNMLKTWQKP